MKMYRQHDSTKGPSPIRMATLHTSPTAQNTAAKEKRINNGLDRDRVDLARTGTKLDQRTLKQNVALQKRGVLGEPPYKHGQEETLRSYTSGVAANH